MHLIYNNHLEDNIINSGSDVEQGDAHAYSNQLEDNIIDSGSASSMDTNSKNVSEYNQVQPNQAVPIIEKMILRPKKTLQEENEIEKLFSCNCFFIKNL